MKSFGKWALGKVGLLGFVWIGSLLSQNVTAGESRMLAVSIEQVWAMCQRSPEDAGKLVAEWMDYGKFPTNFEWNAAMLFLRKLPDVVSKPTLSNVLSRIDVDHDYRSGWRHLVADPISPLLRVAKIRLGNDSVTNSISQLLHLYETNTIGYPRLSLPDGFLQNEIVSTMLAHGIEVPERFRGSPEYIRHEVFRTAKGSTPEEVLKTCLNAVWIPRRKPDEVIVQDGMDPVKVEGDSRKVLHRKIFLRNAYQSLLLQESTKLVDVARAFINSKGVVPDGDEGMSLTMQLIWSYVIVARHSAREDAVVLRKQVEHLVGEKRAAEALLKLDGVIESTSDLWWYKECAFPSTSRDSFWSIYAYAISGDEHRTKIKDGAGSE